MSENDFLDITTATEQQGSYIKVIGVGGAGTNAVNHMYNRGITGVDFIVCNTDEQSLNSSPITTKIKIGEGGLGAGNKPEVAQKAAIAASDRIKSVLDSNTHMLFITAGMGGGTGTGASPEIAKIAKEIEIDGGNDEILVVAVVTIPFSFEGRKRREQARIGIENLKKTVDSIIIVNTDKLKSRGNMSMKNAFALADDVLLTAAKGISEIMTANAYIHVDFRDVQSIMQHSGVALMGSGTGEGEDRAYEAIKAATTSDLLNDNDLKQTQNILLYISYSSKEEYQLQTDELETITNYIQEITNADVDMIWGCGTDDTLEGKVSITLVATGFESQEIYHTPERSISAGVKAPVAQEPVTQVLNIAQEPANEIKQQPVQPAVHQPVVTDNNTQTSAQYNKVISDTDFTVTKKEEPASQFSSVKEKESEVVTITLGEDNPYAKHEETKQEKQPVTEDKDDIMAQFAKADTVKQTFVLDVKETETDSMAEEEYKNETSVQPQATLFAQVTASQLQEEPAVNSLKDLAMQGTQNNAQPQPSFTSNQAAAIKQDRIKRIHDLLKQGKVSLVQSLRPDAVDFDEKLSQQNISDVRMTVNKEGGIQLTENPVIGSQVD